MKPTRLLALGCTGLALLVAAPLHAADTPEPAAAHTSADPLARAREAIAAQRWPAAVSELRRGGLTGSADWNNLMGFALRKQARPDLDGAQRHYDAALRIDPNHQGALEYAGELDLMRGRLADAEQKLERLARLCSSPCEPLDDLRKAIVRFKSSGNRYVP